MAARGLDIPEVDLVIQCEPPKVRVDGIEREREGGRGREGERKRREGGRSERRERDGGGIKGGK